MRTADNTAGTTVTYTYDSIGRLQSETNQLGRTEYYAYDSMNNLIATKDRRGTVVNYTYDNMNRLTNKASGTLSASYTYTPLGKVSTMTDTTGTTTYTYNAYNLLTNITNPNNSSISYAYDLSGQLVGVNGYNNEMVTYTYDLLKNVSSIARGGTAMANYTYNSKNQLASVTYPGQGATTYEYDGAMRLVGLTNTLANGTIINEYDYEYDSAGNQTKKTETISGTAKVTNYTYDALNRLSSYTEPDGTVTSYTFDARNNITNKNIDHPESYYFDYSYPGYDFSVSVFDVETHTFNYTYNAANQLLKETETVVGDGSFEGSNNYTYDLNGNMLDKEADDQYDDFTNNYSYSYDAFNRLEHVYLTQQWELWNGDTNNVDLVQYNYVYAYSYNGNNELSVVTTTKNNELQSTKKHYWDRGYIVQDSTTQGTTTTEVTYYLGAGGVFAQKDNGGTVYLIKNGHGDTVKTVKDGALAYGTVDYDPYGNRKGSCYSPYTYANYYYYYYDLNSGFYYLRNRFYDPRTERFISEDPAQDGTNWYAYCGGNPVNRWDPSGQCHLEKDADNQVYAAIEPGDTLSEISYSEVRDSTAYTKLNYAEPGNLEVGQYVNITGIYNDNYPVPTNIALAKTSHTQGDSGLRDVSDDEISRRARDRSLSGEERRRYQREEKLRGYRNKQKRQNHYNKSEIYGPQLPDGYQYPEAPAVSEPHHFWQDVSAGAIVVVGIAAGIVYFFYTGSPDMIYQFAN